MNRNVARCLYGILLAGGLTFLGATAANATGASGNDGGLPGTVVSSVGDSPSAGGSGATTSGDHSIGGGTQVAPTVNAPVVVSGNAVSGIGDSKSSDSTVNVSQTSKGSSGPSTSGDHSIGGGTQVAPTVNAPVVVSGNAVSGIGDSKSSDSTVNVSQASKGSSGPSTSGDHSILGGTQVAPVVNAPVVVSGNAVSVIGDSKSSDSTVTVSQGSHGSKGSSGPSTSGDHSILGGTQVAPVVNAPVVVSGNAVSVIGDSKSSDSKVNVSYGHGSKGSHAPKCSDGSYDSKGSHGSKGSSGPSTSGDHSILGGTQLAPVVNTPMIISGNAVSVIGDSKSSDSKVNVSYRNGSKASHGSKCSDGSYDRKGWHGPKRSYAPSTSGDHSILGGTQVAPTVNAPVIVSGNAVSVIGDSKSSDSKVNVSQASKGSYGPSTSGDHSILGGTQVAPVVNAPVIMSGNAVSVIGDSKSSDSKVNVW